MTLAPVRPSRRSPSSPTSVAIVGGGASGVLTAIALLSSGPYPDLRVTLHEARAEVGRGVAYGTTDARHLLNVRARHMSALHDVPSDLLDWGRRTGRDFDPQAFLPRREYACYLRDTLAEHADDRLSIATGRVEDLVVAPDGFEVRSTQATTTASHVVLAHGNQAPAPLAVDGRPVPATTWHLPDPWDLDALGLLADDAVVVLVGTGLTAVDTAITLLETSPERRVVMVSRQGLLPRSHVEQASTAWVSPVPEGELTADGLAQHVAGQIAAAAEQGVGWRPVVDGLRAPTQGLWLRLGTAERRRFLTTYARAWEIRRHRMAPEVAERIARHQETGRLRVLAGGLASVRSRGRRCVVGLGSEQGEVCADALVNCTGPLTDVRRSNDPLLTALATRGVVAPDPLALGLACTPSGEVLDRRGALVDGLYVVGPPRKGTLYESTAVPEIRTQAGQLAARIGERALRSA